MSLCWWGNIQFLIDNKNKLLAVLLIVLTLFLTVGLVGSLGFLERVLIELLLQQRKNCTDDLSNINPKFLRILIDNLDDKNKENDFY